MEADPLSECEPEKWVDTKSESSPPSHAQQHQEKVSRKVEHHLGNWVAGFWKQMDGLDC
jgi:hypothetical protein